MYTVPCLGVSDVRNRLRRIIYGSSWLEWPGWAIRGRSASMVVSAIQAREKTQCSSGKNGSQHMPVLGGNRLELAHSPSDAGDMDADRRSGLFLGRPLQTDVCFGFVLYALGH